MRVCEFCHEDIKLWQTYITKKSKNYHEGCYHDMTDTSENKFEKIIRKKMKNLYIIGIKKHFI
ncbi:MAG: hypothetical protein KatS3mg002_0586 [Candidatus Woesearchaeota archaeon]|nr:MAG: hypothetical protein KatS3mg002_0586 [Candidatus Woesearchaeota archaeon]